MAEAAAAAVVVVVAAAAVVVAVLRIGDLPSSGESESTSSSDVFPPPSAQSAFHVVYMYLVIIL